MPPKKKRNDDEGKEAKEPKRGRKRKAESSNEESDDEGPRRQQARDLPVEFKAQNFRNIHRALASYMAAKGVRWSLHLFPGVGQLISRVR